MSRRLVLSTFEELCKINKKYINYKSINLNTKMLQDRKLNQNIRLGFHQALKARRTCFIS